MRFNHIPPASFMLLFVPFVVLPQRVGGFCTAYAPLAGSRFSFPPRRCLTQQFMDQQFQNNVFGKEPINLQSSVKNIMYSGISMPLALESSLGWESGHMVSAIADIVLREILGINTTFVCTWGSVHAMKLLGGCTNPMDPVQPCMVGGAPQLSVPLAHVSVESWVTTPAEVDEMNAYNTNLGMIGYYSKSGLYMDKAIADEAYRKDRISLEWWQNFVDYPSVGQYFDSYTTVAADISSTWPDGSVFPRCQGTDPGFLELQSLGFACTHGWFFSPVCQANKTDCVPVILAEYDWNGLVWIRAIVQNGYRFAVTWLGSQNWLTYSMRASTKLMFYCATTSALCYEKPIVKMFADSKMPVGRPDLITSLLKVVWKQIPNIDSRIVEFLSQMNLPSEDLQALMTSYSAKQAWNDIDTRVPEIACNWLTNKLNVTNVAGTSTGLNTAKWARWIPRTCHPGHHYDRANGECRPCNAGEYSLDGRGCVPCSPGTYAAEPALNTCKLCAEGRWQSSSRGTSCDACPAGSERKANERGCQLCAQGHFSEHTAQAICRRCDLGTWSNVLGATACSQCPSAYTTSREASETKDACIVDHLFILQICSAVCAPFISVLVVVLCWRWRRYRRQMKEARDREQLYFRGAVAVMRTMCSSGVTLTITPQGYIQNSDPKGGLEGLREGTHIQACITDANELERFNRHLREVMSDFESLESPAFASPFNFSISGLSGGDCVQLKSFAVAFKKDEILMGLKRKKGEFLEQPPVMPMGELKSTASFILNDALSTSSSSERRRASMSPQPYMIEAKSPDRESLFDCNIPLSVLPGSVAVDDEVISFALSSTVAPSHDTASLVRRRTVLQHLCDSQTQTDPEPTSRPPLLPGDAHAAKLFSSEISSSRSRSRSRSGSRSRSESAQKKEEKEFVSDFNKMPKHAVAFILVEAARIIPIKSAYSCCRLHAALNIMSKVIVSKSTISCNHDWKPCDGWQCKECCALNDDTDWTCQVCSGETR